MYTVYWQTYDTILDTRVTLKVNTFNSWHDAQELGLKLMFDRGKVNIVDSEGNLFVINKDWNGFVLYEPKTKKTFLSRIKQLFTAR